MSSDDLIDIYNSYKNRALKEGFDFYDDFWNQVNRFVDPFEADAETWAIGGQLAYRALCEDKNK